tara:strand:- start:10840 stop:11409 length:570 start_codon:yes stop_codon:yes gene_type:complete
MKIHSLTVSSEMRVLEYDLKVLRNFEKINSQLEKDILLAGDEQNNKTNVKAQMTSWQMANRYKSFQDLLKILIINILPNYENFDIVSGGKAKLVATGMWGAVYREGSHTIEHNHIGSQYSFVYYVKANINSSPIIFTSPGSLEIIPKTGMVLLWDSRYKHMVPKQNNDDPRIIVAGNLNWQLPEKNTYV